MENVNELEQEVSGRFYENLTRSPKEIVKKRATEIALDVKDEYDAVLRELQKRKRNLLSERRNNEDLSPASKDSLEFKNSFAADAWVKRDLEISIELDKLDIQIKSATKRIEELF